MTRPASGGLSPDVLIRPAISSDHDALWRILAPVIRAGETYALPRDMNREDALAYWNGPDRRTFVAENGGQVVGTYYLRANQAGGGAHVANCGYMVGADQAGKGVGGALCDHSLDKARAAGFRAMQFNFVVSTNEGAVRLWRAKGFGIVGRLPGAFDHPRLGFVDALAMFRAL